jgi:hypothetical protein
VNSWTWPPASGRLQLAAPTNLYYEYCTVQTIQRYKSDGLSLKGEVLFYHSGTKWNRWASSRPNSPHNDKEYHVKREGQAQSP